MMLDDDDLALVAWGSNPFTLVGAVFTIVILVIVAYVVWGNHKECETRVCPNKGEVVKLIDHQCLCVTPAITPTSTGQ